jgi:hypothetical protein
MLSTSETFSRASRDLLDAQLACFANLVQALMDDGVNATQRNVDAIKTLLATATVASRQCFVVAAASDRSGPAEAHTAAVSDAGTVARTSLE